MATSAALGHRAILALKCSPVSSVLWVFPDYSSVCPVFNLLWILTMVRLFSFCICPGTGALMYIIFLNPFSIHGSSSSLLLITNLSGFFCNRSYWIQTSFFLNILQGYPRGPPYNLCHPLNASLVSSVFCFTVSSSKHRGTQVQLF